jgi:hypothetical protein
MQPEVYTGVDGGWAQMAVGGPTETFIYSVRRVVIEVTEGDVLDIYAEAQVRNDLGYNVELGNVLSIRDFGAGDTAPATYNTDFDDGRVGPINGSNITPGNHYGRPTKGFRYVVPAGRTKVAIDLRLRARSSGTSGGVVNLAIQQDQGLIQVLRWPAPAAC